MWAHGRERTAWRGPDHLPAPRAARTQWRQGEPVDGRALRERLIASGALVPGAGGQEHGRGEPSTGPSSSGPYLALDDAGRAEAYRAVRRGTGDELEMLRMRRGL